MHCEEFEIRLQEVLDARQPPEGDEALLAHADACEPCRELLAVQEQLFAGLELWDAPALPADFAARVLAAAEEPILAEAVPASAKPTTSSGHRWIGVAIAAGLLIAFLPVARWLATPTITPPVATKESGPTPQPPAHPAVATALEPVSTPNIVPAATASQPMPFLPEQLAAGSEEMLRSLQNLPEVPVDQSVERIPGFRPIANSFGLAISGFRRTLPGGKETPPPAENKSPPPTKPQADTGHLQDRDLLV